MKTRLLLEISSISPLIAGFLHEILFEIFDSLILFEKVQNLGGKGIGCQLSLLEPNVPFVSILPFQELNDDITRLLVLVIRNIIVLKLTSVVVDN